MHQWLGIPKNRQKAIPEMGIAEPDPVQAHQQLVQLLKDKDIIEQQLKEQRDVLSNVVEYLPIALFVKNIKDNYRFLIWNAKAEQQFGLRKQDVIGKTDYDHFPKEQADYFRATDEQVMHDNNVVDIGEESLTVGEDTFIAHTIKLPIYDKNGAPSLLVGMIEDVTERKRAGESLHAQREAERANKAKSEFLANMSHELRTPLNSIIGMANLMGDTMLENDQKNMMNVISQSSESLLELVNDILDLSRIEANVTVLELTGVDIASLVARTIDALKPLASKKGLVLMHECKTKGIPYVLADPGKFARIITNLVTNAIKYTDQGSVRAEASYQHSGDKAITLTFRVTDTGVGIDRAYHEVIFTKFTQVDSSTTRRHGGTGLGLTITRELVEMMGGTIGVQSMLGRGSTFTVQIPLETTPSLHKESATEVERENNMHSSGLVAVDMARILVAEDHVMNQALIRKLMQKLDLRHDIVDDGNAVLNAIREGAYDAILMDCHMPGMSGYEATNAIRALGGGQARIPIIAMTANAMMGDREKCLDAGMNDYISKPIEFQKLKKILSRYINFGALPGGEEDKGLPVDLTHMRKFSDGDKSEERRLVNLFIHQNRKALEMLKEHCINGESMQWADAAHLLKSGAASIGAAHLRTLCSQAQEQRVGMKEERQRQIKAIEVEIARITDFFAAEGLLLPGSPDGAGI